MAFRNISVAISGDVSQYRAALEQASKMTRQFKQQAAGAVATVTAPRVDTRGTRQATSSLNTYKAATAQAAAATDRLGASLIEVNKRGTHTGQHLAAIQLMTRDASLAAADSMTMYGKAVQWTTSMTKQLVATAAGYVVIHGFVNALARSFTFMKESFIEFDDKMVQSMAIMDRMTEKQIETLEASVRSISSFTTFSPGEAAEGLYFLASAGYDASQSMVLLEHVARFAQASLMDFDKASEMVTDLQKTFNQLPTEFNNFDDSNFLFDPGDIERTEKGMQRVTDVVAKAADISNAAPDEIGNALNNKLGAYARQIGMNIEEASAMLMALASRGTKDAVAGTQSYMALRDLMRTALEVPDRFAKVGIEVFDPDGDMKHFADIIEDMENALGPLSDAGKKQLMSDLGFQDRSMTAILSFMGASQEIRDNFTMLMEDSEGYAEEVSERQMTSIRKTVRLVSNFMASMAVSIGRGLEDGFDVIAENFAPALNKLVDGLKAVWTSAQPVVNILGKAVGGGLLIAIKGLAQIVSFAAEIMERFPGIVAGIAGAFALNKFKNIPIIQKQIFSFFNTWSGGIKGENFGAFIEGQGGKVSRGIGKMTASFRGFFRSTKGVPTSLEKVGLAMTPNSHFANTEKYISNLDQFTAKYIHQHERMAIVREKYSRIFKDGLSPIFSAAGRAAGGSIIDIGKAVALPFRAAISGVRSAGSVIGTSVANIGKAISLRFRTTMSQVRSIIAQSKIGQALSAELTSLKVAGAGGPVAMVRDLMRRMGTEIKSTRLGSMVAAEFNTLKSARQVSGFFGMFSDLVQRAKTDITQSRIGLGIKAEFDSLKVARGTMGTLGMMSDLIKRIGVELSTSKIGAKLSQAMAPLASFRDKLSLALGASGGPAGLFGNLFTASSQRLSAMFAPAMAMAGRVRTAISVAFNTGPMLGFADTSKWLANQIAREYTAAIAPLREGMMRAMVNLQTAGTSAVDRLRTSLKGVPAAMGGFVSTVRALPGQVASAFNTAYGNTRKFLSNMRSNISDLRGRLSGWWGGFIDSSKTALNRFTTNSTEAFKKFKSRWSRLGDVLRTGDITSPGVQGRGAIAAARADAQLSQMKLNALVGVHTQMLEVQNALKIHGAALDAAETVEQRKQIQNEILLNQQKEAGLKKDMAAIAAAKSKNELVALGAAKSKTASITGGLAAAAPMMMNVAMAGMMILPGMMSDMGNRMRDAGAKLEEDLRDAFDIDLTEVKKKGSLTDVREAIDALWSEWDDLAADADGWGINLVKEGGNGGVSRFVRVAGETLVGWIPGVDEHAKDAVAGSKQIRSEVEQLEGIQKDINNAIADFFSGKVGKDLWTGDSPLAQFAKSGDLNNLISEKASKMGISIKTKEDVLKVMRTLKNEMERIKFGSPEVDFSQFEGDMEGLVEFTDEKTGEMDELSEAFQETMVEMFGTAKMLEAASEYAEAMRSALKTPVEIFSDLQSDIDEAMGKQAEAATEAYNDAIDAQIKAIEKKKKDLQKAWDKRTEKIKSSSKKDRMKEAEEAELEAIEAEKDALQESKKTNEDFKQERKVTMDEYITGLRNGGKESERFNRAMEKLAQNGASPELLKSFREMGEEALPMLEQVLSASTGQVQKWVSQLNEEFAKIGKKAVPTVDEIVKQYGDLSAKRDKYLERIFNLGEMGMITKDQAKAITGALGDMAPEIMEQIFADLESGNAVRVERGIRAVNDLTRTVFDADNFYTEGFIEAFDTMFDIITGNIEGGVNKMLDKINEELGAAGPKMLELLASWEEKWLPSSTVARDAHNKYLAGRGEAPRWQLPERPRPMAGDETRQPGGPQPGVGLSQVEVDATDRKNAIKWFNAQKDSNQDQIGKWLSTMGKPGQAMDLLARATRKASQQRMTTAELTKLADFATRWGRNGNTIPMYAQGDIVNRPTLGVFGEDGPEVILPLNKPARMIELLTHALAATGSLPEFANGAVFGAKQAKNWANATMSMGITERSRPAAYDMLGGVGRQGPSSGGNINVLPIPVPVESRTNWNFNGPIQGLTLEQVQAEADKKRRQRNIV